MPVGAYITLERTPTANEVIVDFRTRRRRSAKWARIAQAALVLAIGCFSDEQDQRWHANTMNR